MRVRVPPSVLEAWMIRHVRRFLDDGNLAEERLRVEDLKKGDHFLFFKASGDPCLELPPTCQEYLVADADPERSDEGGGWCIQAHLEWLEISWCGCWIREVGGEAVGARVPSEARLSMVPFRERRAFVFKYPPCDQEDARDHLGEMLIDAQEHAGRWRLRTFRFRTLRENEQSVWVVKVQPCQLDGDATLQRHHEVCGLPVPHT